MLKKFVAFLTAVLLTAVFLTGCDTRPSNPTIDAPPSPPIKVDENKVELPENYTVIIDHAALPETVTKLLSEKELELYKNAVKAFLSFESGVEFSDAEAARKVVNLLSSYCPVIFCNLDPAGPTVNTEEGRIEFPYSTDKKDAHLEAVKVFTKKAEEFIGSLKTEFSDEVVSILLYHKMVSHVSVMDATLPEEGETVPLFENSGYDAIVNGSATEAGVAGAMSFIYTQTGIDNIIVGATYYDEPCTLNLISVEGNRYFCHTAADCFSGSLTAFGLTDERCVSSGLSEFFIPFSDDKVGELFPAKGDLFSEFADGAESIEFKLDQNLFIYENFKGEKWNYFFKKD